MPYYEWRGDGEFHDNKNNRVVEHGEVVELSERTAGKHDFVEVEEPDDQGDDPQGSGGENGEESEEITCAEGDCSRTVEEEGMRCWQHEESDE